MENLKQIRESLKMTQVDVAKAVGVSLATYRLWELGGGNPNKENEKKLREVLNIKD